MFHRNLTIVWIWLAVILTTIFLPLTACFDEVPQPNRPINQYGRLDLLHLADMPLSKLKPLNLPDWVPTKDNSMDGEYRRRGKRGGIRQRVRKRGLRPPLPAITVSNVRSMSNKLDELRANIRYNNEYRNSGLICLTETWLNADIPTNTIEIPGYDVIRQDRCHESTNKTKGGGLCCYINKLWCNNFTIRSSFCCADIELLCFSCRPFYLPREFPQVHVLLVYVPPDANSQNAMKIIHEQVQTMENCSPNSPKIILGDFNQSRLENYLPHFHQCINEPTRGENTLDRCYCSLQNAYKAIVRPGLGKSDHHVIHLLPRYKQRIKSEKPSKKSVCVWNATSKEKLQTAFEITDWQLLINSGKDINESADIINSYVTFCESLHVKTKTITSYPNNKPWVTRDLKQIL